MPLIGCLDLLLADIDQASARFISSSDENLQEWLDNYPGERLEAICIFCKNWLENDVLLGYRDIDVKEVNLDSWFEDREIQEFIEKLEKKSNKLGINSRIQNQNKSVKDFSQNSRERNSYNGAGYFDDSGLPWPGGIKVQDEANSIQGNNSEEEVFQNKSLDFYKFLIEKIAEIKFSLGEFLENKGIFKSRRYIYLYAFLILFGVGIGFGFFRNKLKNPIQNDTTLEKPLKIPDKNKELIEKDMIQENIDLSSIETKLISSEQPKNISLQVKEITNASPSIKEIKYLIDTWLSNKANYMAGNSEIDLFGIVKDGLIKRTIEERQKDLKKGVYKLINSEIEEIVLKSQTSSRIVAVAELKYRERIFKNSGEFVNEVSFSPLKVKYILGFSNKSWKLADFVSGL